MSKRVFIVTIGAIEILLVGGFNEGEWNYCSFTGNIDDVIKDAKDTYPSTAAILQPIIATWYNALRRIAIVGLLSVLLYIGIRIVLTSTSAKDKAKYKKMLKDWLVAVCMLFTLHYIMNITIVVVEKINEVIGASVIGTNGEDVLVTSLRHQIATGDKWGQVIVEIVLYCVIAIYTVIFTIQYFRRTIYIAFLTVIAPLITLTYPLDKIKDGKSQAFDIWIKDYVFFVLIQVVHLLLYYILVASSIDLSEDGNWIFAIVAIGFMTKAEKIMKKWFGFEKSNSMGAMAAGATGALVMNAINKISHKPPKGGQAGKTESSNNNVRTATNTDVLSSIRNGGTSTPGIVGAGGGTSSGLGGANLGTGSGTSTTSKPKRSIKGVEKNGWGGTGALFKKYHRKVGGAVLGAGTGLAGAMIGFAAGVSQGDMGAALTGVIAGGKAGYGLGGRAYNGVVNAPGNLRNSLNNVRDTWNEGAYGSEYASNEKFDREFRRSSTYKALKQKYGNNFSDESVQAILNAGITEQNAMDKILKNVTQGNGYSMEDAIGYYALTKMCKDAGVYYDDDKLKIWLEDQGFGQVNDVTQIRNHMKNF